MKSIFSIDPLTWLGGLAAQTFFKAFFILLLLNGLIDLILVRILDPLSSEYAFGIGLIACLLLAWAYLLWKTEPPILARSILGALLLLLGIGAFLISGHVSVWLIVILGYMGVVIWLVYLRAPAFRAAMQQWQAGNTEQAIMELDRYIESHADAGDAYQYRAWFRLELAQYREAAQDIQSALELLPRSYFAHYLYGRLKLEQGHFPEAMESFQTAVRLGPGRGINYLPLAIIHHLNGEHQLAVEALCNGIGWGFPNPSNFFVAYYYMGRNLDALGETDLAARSYKLMTRFSKGYDTLVVALKNDSNPENPITKLYCADLPDMKHRLYA